MRTVHDQRRRLRPSWPTFLADALTFTADPIVDSDRGTEGDGEATPAGAAIWEGTTNLITNGGFETNTAGYTDAGSTTTRITSQFKFGAACGNVVTDNLAANEGPFHAFTGAAATEYTVSVWVRGGSGGTVRVALYDDVSGKQGSSAVTLTTSWQRITVTATTGGGSATFRAYVETDVQQSLTFQFDGLQVEAKGIPTPYVETDGATAARTAAHVVLDDADVSLDETAGFVVYRFVAEWDNTQEPSDGFGMFFGWENDSSNHIWLYYANSSNTLIMQRRNGGAGGSASKAWSPVKGTTYTLTIFWRANGYGFRISGETTATNAGTDVPTLTNDPRLGARLDGGSTLKNWANTRILWAAFGTGNITLEGEVDWIESQPDNPDVVQWRTFPGQLTGYWDCVTSAFQKAP